MHARWIGLTLVCAWPGTQVSAQLAGEKPQDAFNNAPKAMGTILADELERHATKLSSLEFGGRLTATDGQVKAAKYIARWFETIGLLPLGDLDKQGKRLWTQSYKVKLNKIVGKTSGLFGSDGDRVTRHGAWFVKLTRRAAQTGSGGAEAAKLDPTLVEGELVFAGRGKKSELRELKLEGKIPVFVIEVRPPRKPSVYSTFEVGGQIQIAVMGLTRRAKNIGAKGAIILIRKFDAFSLGYLNMVSRYPGKPRVSLGWGNRPNMMDLMSPRPSVPTLLVGDCDTKAVLDCLKIEPDAAFGYHKAKDEQSQKLVGKESVKRYRFALETEVEKTEAVNVIGLLEGSDPELEDEAVLYSAHMDHLGLAANGGLFPGADDNASGTSVIIEIAEAFSKLTESQRPKRSVIFLAVSGEELGLWGSAHYAKHPTWPLAKTIGNINMDMLGRSTRKVPADTIALTPTNRNPAYNTLAREAAWLSSGIGLSIANGDRFYTRSDHYNFAKRGVPVMFFCDDEHPDYHMITDTSDKLEYGKMAQVGRLAFLIGYRTANRAAIPTKLGKRPGWFQ